KELDELQHHWNTHYIRRSRHDTLPGRPDELYFLPENENAVNHAHTIEEDKYHDMLNYCHEYHKESLYYEYFTHVFTLGGFESPNTWNDALTLYREILGVAE
ncbi:Hypothetical predicted protein, partial [Paramuricea clavata]